MKILILTFNYGKSSSGKTTERIADGLHELGHKIEIVCGQNYTKRKPYKIHRINPNPLKPSRLFKVLGNLFGKELNYFFWEYRAKKEGVKVMEDFQPDILYSRGSPISSMTVGDFLKSRYGKPHVIHFADPIPPTIDWMKNKAERKKLLKTIKPIINNADAISFVTEEMKAYQNRILKGDVNLSKAFISPNPMPNFRYFGKPLNEKIIFLYLGTFPKQRNQKLIIEAFQNFAVNKIDVEFHIYGNKSNGILFNQLDLNFPNVKLFDSTDDINKIIEKAIVLVDVDANLNEPVFISGKLMEYLSVDRYILSVTPNNSPARNFLEGISDSLNFSIPSLNEITSEMEILHKKRWDKEKFFERQVLIEKAGFKNVLKTVEDVF